MAETTPRGIQATLFDYFQDTEYFDLQEANELLLEHQQRDINAESIRARIYEGIEKGLFERVGKGLYTVTRKDDQGRENTCLLINGNGRDLSFLPDDSVDLILTDHPYDTSKSLKGGNRNFADYDLFKYTEQDMTEKSRVLKKGHFCVEFLPEENADNYQYLYQVKEMAHSAGLEYFACVPWKKGDFVANTGRKSKNTENIMFFSKGRARDLRPDAKKDKKYAASRTIVEYEEHIPASTTVTATEMGGLGTSSETKSKPVDVHIRISVHKDDAYRARKLLDDAWDNAVMDGYQESPLDQDYGGSYALEDLFDMPIQDYMLEYLQSCNLSFVDLSPGPKDIFKSDSQVIVNPTNLIGPMGAGLAKEFKNQYIGLEHVYQEACRRREFCTQVSKDGFKDLSGNSNEIHYHDSKSLFEGDLLLYDEVPSQPAVLCFPTKRDWKNPSDLSLIEAGLKTFVNNYRKHNIQSITFPKLGCGLGGLNWEKEVKPLMQKYLGDLPDLDVKICGDTLREDKKEFFMSGAAGMLPTMFDVPVPSKSTRVHQAEKPIELLEQILRFVTKEDELVLDQFGGSGNTAKASLNLRRNSIVIEQDPETFRTMCENVAALGSLQAVTPEARSLVTIGADALVAQDAFNRTGDRNILYNFVQKHKIVPSDLYDGEKDLRKENPLTQEQEEVISKAFSAIEDIDLRADDLDLLECSQEYFENKEKSGSREDQPKVLECSSRGDRRFSALFANVTIKGKEQSIEVWYQNAKRTADGKRAGKGKSFDHIICPFTGDKLPAEHASDLYKGLWITYLSKNPDLVAYASTFDEFHDMFKGKNTVNCQADVIRAYIQNQTEFVSQVKSSLWYQNMVKKQDLKKPKVSELIDEAKTRKSPENRGEAQTSLFKGNPGIHSRS